MSTPTYIIQTLKKIEFSHPQSGNKLLIYARILDFQAPFGKFGWCSKINPWIPTFPSGSQSRWADLPWRVWLLVEKSIITCEAPGCFRVFVGDENFLPSHVGIIWNKLWWNSSLLQAWSFSEVYGCHGPRCNDCGFVPMFFRSGIAPSKKWS